MLIVYRTSRNFYEINYTNIVAGHAIYKKKIMKKV